jgi:hypothetical protein
VGFKVYLAYGFNDYFLRRINYDASKRGRTFDSCRKIRWCGSDPLILEVVSDQIYAWSGWHLYYPSNMHLNKLCLGKLTQHALCENMSGQTVYTSFNPIYLTS